MNHYPLHPGQHEVFTSPRRHRFVVCGRGWGKTHEAVAELCAAVTSDRARELGDSMEVVYVGPSYRQVKAIVWRRLKQIFGGYTRGKPHETDLLLRLKWGPQIRLMGADNVHLSRGMDIHFAVLDEFAFYRDGLWDTLEGCLRTQNDRALLITTPNGPNFALELWNAVQGDPEWATFQKPTWDNPYHDRKGLDARRRRLAAQVFDQEYGASFSALKGAVYSDFSVHRHVQPVEFRRAVGEWYVGQDFNAGNYCAVIGQLMPRDPRVAPERVPALKREDLRLEIVDEMVTKTHLFDHTERLERWFKARGIDHRTQVIVFTDASGDYNATSKVTNDSRILQRAGFRTQHDAQNPPLIDRVHAVQSLILPGDGVPRMTVDPNARELIRALLNQKFNQWGKPEKGKGLDDIADALGYLVNGLFPIRGPSFARVA